MCTVRVFTSITKNTMYRTVPNMPRTSRLKKSQTYNVSLWLFRNCFQVCLPLRSGASSIPDSDDKFALVIWPISIFNPRRASRILV